MGVTSSRLTSARQPPSALASVLGSVTGRTKAVTSGEVGQQSYIPPTAAPADPEDRQFIKVRKLPLPFVRRLPKAARDVMHSFLISMFCPSDTEHSRLFGRRGSRYSLTSAPRSRRSPSSFSSVSLTTSCSPRSWPACTSDGSVQARCSYSRAIRVLTCSSSRAARWGRTPKLWAKPTWI